MASFNIMVAFVPEQRPPRILGGLDLRRILVGAGLCVSVFFVCAAAFGASPWYEKTNVVGENCGNEFCEPLTADIAVVGGS